MLARRMLIFVAVLLALTALAAAFAPPPPSSLGELGAPAAPSSPSDTGRTVTRKLDAGAAEPATIRLEEGDLLHLEVTGEELDAVELRGLGGIRPLGPGAVATFDVLASEPGDYEVVLTDEDETIATIEVLPPERDGLAPTDPFTDRGRSA